MRAAYELTVWFLRLWLAGFVVIVIVAVSDFVFRRPHGLRLLWRRLALSVIWPLAIASSQGRAALFGRFKGV
jgi:hypothetical protein